MLSTTTKQRTTARFVLAKAGAVAVALLLVLGVGCSSTHNNSLNTAHHTVSRVPGSRSTSPCPLHGFSPVLSKQAAGCESCKSKNVMDGARNALTVNSIKKPVQASLPRKDSLSQDDDLLGLPKLVPPVSNPQAATPIKQVSHTTVSSIPAFDGPVLNAPMQNDSSQGPILIPATTERKVASSAMFDSDSVLAVPQPIRSPGEAPSLPPLRSKHYVVDNRLQPQKDKDIVATLFPTMVNLTSQYNSRQNHCPGKSTEATNIFVRQVNAPNTEPRNVAAQTDTQPVQISEHRRLHVSSQPTPQRFEPDNIFAARNTVPKTPRNYTPQSQGVAVPQATGKIALPTNRTTAPSQQAASPRAASGCARWSEEPTNIFFRSMSASNIRQQQNMSNAKPLVRPEVAQTARQHAVSSTGDYVAQTSYQRPVTAPQQVLPLNNVAMSVELTKPWDSEVLRKRSPDGKTYRLVSDTQTDRIPPPSGGAQFENMEAATMAGQQVAYAQQKSGGLRLPIFDLGKNIAKELKPSTDRKWTQNHTIQQTASMNGNRITVHNVRYSMYETAEKYTTRYYDATFNLDEIQTLDIIIVPFRSAPRVAHVESSFGFADGRYLGMSIEARYEEGEKYDPVGAGLNQFELIYLFADERDLIRLGTDVHKNNVEVYRLRLEPKEVREIFVAATQRANKLAVKPEFYHPLKNSCVTNLIGHINAARPNAIPREYRTLLPGLMDGYLFDLGLLATSAKTFKEAKENAKVNWLVEKYGDLEYFSAGIRQNMY